MDNIGIVTLPLHFNFGGILQAYALQETIRDLGGIPYIITPQHKSIKQRVKAFLYSRAGVSKFVKRHISYLIIAEPFTAANLKGNDISTLIVGSDQVWRPCMGGVDRYFLKTDENCVRKIAYAASFGVDYWDFSDDETTQARKLVSDFAAVSVREESGIILCSQHLGVADAVQVLDPTMLIDVEKYKTLMAPSPFNTDKSHCFIYLLDYNSEANQGIVESLLPNDAETMKAKVERNVMKKYLNASDTVENWLSAIYNSDMMITDSFHGCVFSILFHTDFFVMGNAVGGNARIQSLLSLFGLQDRYIGAGKPKDVSPIDWTDVDNRLRENKHQSINFLKTSLSL